MFEVISITCMNIKSRNLPKFILRRGKERRRIMEKMYQAGIHCMHIWKRYDETTCTTIMHLLNILRKKDRQEGRKEEKGRKERQF
jgi:hypothetical protein